ncbi:MAG: hypothetical protein KAH21_08845, partial [Spirochaetaceae bacterium]|nr:hypothetical protein [Spirochaetaceae bacterium]
MSRKSEILIHTALYSEAKPIIAHFSLRQYETRPFKIFRGTAPGGGQLNLIVSGLGKLNCRNALIHYYNGHKTGRIKIALNIGMAGCNNDDIPVGSVFCTHGEIPGIPILPLQTVDKPAVHLNYEGSCLVDMEADYFLETSKAYVSAGKLYVVKVVSDYLEDTIKPSGDIFRLIGDSISSWEMILDDYPEKMELVIRESPFGNL